MEFDFFGLLPKKVQWGCVVVLAILVAGTIIYLEFG